MGMDLWIAIGFVAAISGLALMAGRRLSLSVYRNRPLLFLECLAFSLVFAFGVVGRLTWAHAFPTPAAVCWSNWMPIFLAFTAGLASEMSGLRCAWRKAAAFIFLVIAGGFLVLPVARPHLSPIELAEFDQWHEGVCLQSNESSCGPAAVATLLRQRGVLERSRRLPQRYALPDYDPTSCEAYLAGLCLTSNEGTSSLGLFRGLKMSLEGTGMKARVADSDPRFWSSKDQLPNVAVVQFEASGTQSLVRGLIHRDGEKHAIVIHGREEDGRWLVADPAMGWSRWDDQTFRAVFTGEAIYIARN